MLAYYVGMPFCQQDILHIHTTYQSGTLRQGGEQGQPSENGS